MPPHERSLRYRTTNEHVAGPNYPRMSKQRTMLRCTRARSCRWCSLAGMNLAVRRWVGRQSQSIGQTRSQAPSHNSECTTIAVGILAARSAALASCAAKVGPPASLAVLVYGDVPAGDSTCLHPMANESWRRRVRPIQRKGDNRAGGLSVRTYWHRFRCEPARLAAYGSQM